MTFTSAHLPLGRSSRGSLQRKVDRLANLIDLGYKMVNNLPVEIEGFDSHMLRVLHHACHELLLLEMAEYVSIKPRNYCSR